MAKKVNLSYQEIESALKRFKAGDVSAEDVGYVVLKAFGKSDADIRRYREGKGVVAGFDGLLVKSLLCYKSCTTAALTSLLEALKRDSCVAKAAPMIIAVSDGQTILAYDTRERETYENPLARMYCDFAFFYPLAGVEKVRLVEESIVDMKAAEKLAKLHDEIRAYNEFSSDQDLHELNIFIARLLFCFFAEDTGIFEDNLFTDSVRRFTIDDGSDLTAYLENAFAVMDKSVRGLEVNSMFKQFPYVNGGLFSHRTSIPRLSRKARRIIIECGELNWAEINPDIFGSMIQTVVNPDERANQGMHYTSVPNIMKVIQPLFLDDLREAFGKIAQNVERERQLLDAGLCNQDAFYRQCVPMKRACDKLLLRMSRMKFFDPACGSGNFLVITYKELRELEMDILRLKLQCTAAMELQFIDSSAIRIDQFYGIELLDFPHEVAMLSMWLAEHQMNRKFHREFGVNTKALPLKTITQIRCANACRVDWNEVCPHTPDEDVFVFGNPPYLGARLQDQTQKDDMEIAMGNYIAYNNLDYIGTWFIKGTNYIKGTKASLAFVTTNSISQGEQVSLLWPYILKQNVEIGFAYHSFKWSNNAKYNAGVTCAIIGLRNQSAAPKYIFDNDNRLVVERINPYLLPGTNCIVSKSNTVPQNVPNIAFGSMPNDDGALSLDKMEKDELLQQYPESKALIHPLLGAQEFIRGEERYCLWITDDLLSLAEGIPPINKRIEHCREERLNSNRKSTNKLADVAHKFGEIRYKETESIIIPGVSSENREYIPIGFLAKGTVITNSAFAIYDAEVWLFGLLTSKMHMAWVRTVGGKLETRYRYSAQLCYNTFPFPEISDETKAEIEDAANEVLDARDNHPGLTLADLYDPDRMPADLREAHNRLDDIIDSCYPGYPLANDEARLETLFRLYEKMTKGGN